MRREAAGPGRRLAVAAVAALAVAALGAGCTTAHEAGKQAAQGAISGASAQAPPAPGAHSPLEKATQGVAQGALQGMLEQLQDPRARRELVAVVGTIADDAARRAVAGALAAADAPEQRARLEELGRTVGRGAALELTAQLSQQLGADGSGPLAQVMTATAGRVAGASAHAAGEDVARRIGIWPFVLAFAAGVVVTFLLLGAWSSLRLGGPHGLRPLRRQPA